ncbi:MAG: ABC transporter ATP-binding protein, partial [Spirochaetales bacterium]
MKRYYKYIKPKLIFFILSPFFMFVEVYCDVKIPLLAAQIINVGVTTGNHAYILHTTGVMFLYLLLAVCSGSTSAYCAAKASSFFAGDLREDLFIKIQQFSFATIDKFSPGSLVTRLTNDITQMQNLVTMCLRLMCRAPGMLIGALIMAFTINTKIALIFVVLIPILATVIVLVLLAAYKRFMLLQVKIDALNSNIREFLTNIRLVKSLTREDFETQKFKSVNADLKETGLGAFRITVLQMPIMVFIVNLATIAIIWFGSKALDANELLVGDISAFITYLAQILMSVMMLAMLILQSSRAMASSKRITEVLDTDIDIKDGTTSDCTRTVTGGEIEFKKVCFKYFKDTPKPVLDTVSVRIKSGESVGIIGPTGCGKTSFVHLIPRLYDTDSGSVYVDGINVKDYTLENLRAGIAVVLQNNVLFSGSIKENLLWGDKKACDEDIE